MLIRNKYFISIGKGATSYEIQLHRLYIRFCFLFGGHWKYKFFKRFKIYWLTKELNVKY